MITTRRLLLRPFRAADAPDVERLAGAREVAANTLLIPHPYPPGAALTWIGTHRMRAAEGLPTLAIEREGTLVGAIGLEAQREHDRAEIGYWIGVPFWSQGYATEAVEAMIRFGFEEQNLRRIYALVFSRNAASARVLQKAGMQHEGTLRQHVKKWDEYVDVEMYGILKRQG